MWIKIGDPSLKIKKLASINNNNTKKKKSPEVAPVVAAPVPVAVPVVAAPVVAAPVPVAPVPVVAAHEEIVRLKEKCKEAFRKLKEEYNVRLNQIKEDGLKEKKKYQDEIEVEKRKCAEKTARMQRVIDELQKPTYIPPVIFEQTSLQKENRQLYRDNMSLKQELRRLRQQQRH